MNQNKEGPHSYVPTLNGWRALSIIYVILYHGSWFFFNPESGTAPNEWLWQLSKNGAFGVYFFFGISGYLITTRLIEENDYFGNVSLKSFYWRRFFRIIPILLVFLLVIFILKSLNLIAVRDTALFSSLFFFRNYTADVSEWFTGHFWSLSMEEHYYLLWPSLFIFTVKLKRPWVIVLGILFLVTTWRIIEYRYRLLAPHLATTEFRGRTDLFFDYMMWGSLAAFLNKRADFKQWFIRFSRPWMIYIVIFFIHLLFFIKVPLIDTFKGILIQLALLLTINFKASSFSRILENKILSKIGLYSYSLYVWQQLVLTPANQRIGPVWFLQTPPVNILILAGLAYLSYNWLEAPAINYGKKFLARLNLAR